MNSETPVDDEYEPADIDPDAPLASSSTTDDQPPVEADPADWLDQQRPISDDADDEEEER